jgi:hypothetical protein
VHEYTVIEHYTIEREEMRYHQHANFHIKEVVCTLATLYGRTPIIITHRLSLIIELQSTMQTLFFSMIITGWWSIITGHGLRLTNINCMCVSVSDP